LGLKDIIGKLRGRPVTSEELMNNPDIAKDPCFVDITQYSSRSTVRKDYGIGSGTLWGPGIVESDGVLPSTWECQYCNTMNPHRRVHCAHCGAPHKKEPEC